ncbi:MAG: rane protein [Bacteroidetes bacterium]|nr:rane protein [Bacteroidota bacterium]
MQPIGKMLVAFGIVMVGMGVLLMFSDKIPFLGKLPGDISIKRENLQFFFPITSSIIISILLSAAFWLFSYFKGK